jgi:Tol biopolymer transport system component
MNRHLIGMCGALVLGAVLMPSASAHRDADWSTPVNLGPVVNSPFSESGPAVSRDGLSLYFASTRSGGFGNADLYVARRENCDLPWDSAVNLGPVINTDSFELTPALSRDERHLFFVSPRASGLADIWVSSRGNVHDDFGWQPPVMLGPAINTTTAIDSKPSYFQSRKGGLPQLFFHSNRPGGAGGHDIYVADAFGAAVLIPELNTPQNDQGATISRNGLEMFFQSDRPGGFGASDLWVSVRSSVFSPWSAPENLGEVVNSAADDQIAGLSADGEALFFTSNRPGGFGMADIYMTTRTTGGTKHR